MANQNAVIGVDVGGTKTAAGLVVNGRVRACTRQPTGRTRGDVLTHIETVIAALFSPSIRAIGIGLPGQVDHEAGIARRCDNLPASFLNVPVVTLIERRFHRPVVIDNDANFFTLAEAMNGAGCGRRIVVGLTVGTGIGSGITTDGVLWRGANNVTELGHTTISQTGPACSCGQHGHAEALVSGAGIRWQYRRLTGRRETTVAIAERARRGERAARQTFTTTAAHLATLMVNIIHTINPDCIVVGGGLGVLPQLTDVAFRLVRPRLLYPALRTTRLSRSTLGLDAGILGAAAQASGLPGRFRSRPLPRQVGRGHQGRSAPSGIGSADHSFPLAPPSRRPSAGGLPGRFRSRVRR